MTREAMVWAALACAAGPAFAQSQGTAFTYQGQLSDAGDPAAGAYDFRFALYDLPAGGVAVAPLVDRDDVAVVEGGFSLTLDFGGQAFVGQQRFLEVSVRAGASTGAYTVIGPRQELTPTPAAMFSAIAPWSGVSGLPAGFADNEDDDALGVLACAADQIPRWGGASWFCSDDQGVAYTAGGGLELVQGSLFIIADGGVSQAKLANGAVTELKLADASVTSPKIATDAVTGQHIAPASIPLADIGGAGCTSNQVMTWNGAAWVCASLGPGGNAHDHLGQAWNGTSETGLAVATSGSTGLSGRTDGTAPGSRGVFGLATSSAPDVFGVQGRALSSNGAGVLGESMDTSASSRATGVLGRTASRGSAGVEGVATATDGTGAGVRGRTDGLFAGVHGIGPVGVVGESTSASPLAESPGVLGLSAFPNGRGVSGTTTASGADGVYGESAFTSGNGTGGYFVSRSRYGTAAFAYAPGPPDPEGLPSTGVWGRVDSPFGRAVYGEATATSGPAIGVLGSTRSSSGYAGYFDGNVEVTGILTVPAGLVQIDHPSDPENRYLLHAAVASSELKNLYDGVVVTDESGYAVVELPPWFEHANRDFRYQLTVLDDGDQPGFVQAKVVRKIAGGRFALRTSAPRVEVSWMVTGVRADRYAGRHPIEVERAKPVEERGTYLHTAEWDQPRAKDRRRPEREVRP